MKGNNKEFIKNILEVDNIENNNLPYYYTDKQVYCCDINLKPTFQIEDFDYIEPIKKLAEYYKESSSDYYQKVISSYGKENLKVPVFLKDFDYDKDEILLQYSKCISDSSIMIVWPISNIKTIQDTSFYNEIQKHGKVHWIKEINLTKKQVQGLIYQVYYDKSGFKEMKAIKGKQEKSKADEQKNKFFIIMYKADKFNEISGTDAALKVKFREILRSSSGTPSDTKPNLFLHITDNHTQVVELAQLFCNKNSIRILQYQRLDRILYKDFYKSYVNLMTYKNWIYQNIDPLEHVRFLLVSGITLYALGLRQASDVDIIILPYPRSNTKTPNFFKIIDEYLFNKSSRFEGMEGVIKKEDGWYLGEVKYDYMNEWTEKEWPALYGAPSMDDTILNPEFHFYYFGLKMIVTKAEVKRRIKRSRAAAYADLIAMIKVLDVPIQIPPVPKSYWSAHEFKEYTEKDINTLYKKTQWYLRKRYNIFMEFDEIKRYVRFSA
jgi:hypothetical protein